MRVLIASCIRQKPEILKEFLESLDELQKPKGYEYFFILSDLEKASRKVLADWSHGKPVEKKTIDFNEPYITDEDTHHWTPELVSNVIRMKNKILERAGDYDYLLFVDSDTYLHPKTLIQLLSREKDIITEISWTKWYADDRRILPSAWFFDNYGFPSDGIQRLINEPLVKVGGFGGLYLISKKALKAGVSFTRVEGKPDDWGEDRHFAARALKLGFNLWCDTTMPSFHIYRMSDLLRLQRWKKNGFMNQEPLQSINKHEGILISIPNTGQIKTELMTVVLNIAMRNPQFIGVDLPQGMPVDSNRNNAVQRFLSSRFEWLLFIDSDVVPPIDVVERLLRHRKKIVSGLVWSSMAGEKGKSWEHDPLPYPTSMIRDSEGEGWKVARKQLESNKTLIQVDAVGMACILIHREVFEKMDGNWFRLTYGANGICDGGEDFTFCMKAKEIGYEIWADKSVQCSHYKSVDLRKINELLAKTARGEPVED